ncbi:hypothetical protein [Nostoc sp.]
MGNGEQGIAIASAPCPIFNSQSLSDIAAAIALNIARLTKEIKIQAS